MTHHIGADRVSSAAWRCARCALVLAAVGACGGGGTNGGGGPPPGSGTMTATIDGQAFASDSQAATATAASTLPGSYFLTGTKVTSTTNYLTLTIALYNIAATGTYPLGVTSTIFGGHGGVFQVSGAGTVASWDTPLSGASGMVTVSTLTANRIAGTFAFTAAPTVGSTSTRIVTDGSFDLPVTGSAGTMRPNAGSSMTARLNGTSWTAAAVVIVGYSSGLLAFGGGTSAGNPTYQLNFTLGPLTGPGTYPFTRLGPFMSSLGIIRTFKLSFLPIDQKSRMVYRSYNGRAGTRLGSREVSRRPCRPPVVPDRC